MTVLQANVCAHAASYSTLAIYTMQSKSYTHITNVKRHELYARSRCERAKKIKGYLYIIIHSHCMKQYHQICVKQKERKRKVFNQAVIPFGLIFKPYLFTWGHGEFL